MSLLFLTGFQFHLAHLASYLLFILLGCTTFSCLGSLCGTVIDKPENLGRFEAVVIYPVIFKAGLFFPISAYPENVLPFIRAIPTTALFDGARNALLTGKVDPGYLLTLAGSAVISFVAAVRVFEKKMRG